jgi:hypothetical protein
MMDHSYSCCAGVSSKSPPLPTDGGDLGADAPALLNVKEGTKTRTPCGGRARVAVDVCLAAACLAGGALLTWWALLFQHPSHVQVWMVPVGLVLGCTPVVVCVALRFSSSADDTPPAPLSAVVVIK